MISDQLSLFENLKLKNKIKNVDYVDLSTVPDDPARSKYGDGDVQYKNLPVGKYFIFKKGGYNVYKPKQGNVFPYVQNQFTGKILNASSTLTDFYPKVSLSGDRNNIKYKITSRIHRLVGLAFFTLPDTFYTSKNYWVVNHIDGSKENYEISNLEWVTQKQNCSTGKNNSAEVQAKIKKYIFS